MLFGALMSILACGIDPGFSSLGWSLVELSTGDHVVATASLVSLGLIRTEKSTAKQNVLASNDNFRRAREIAVALRKLFEVRPAVVCCESMSFPRNASAAAKVAMTWGVLADLCESQGIPMLMATPKELKRSVCGNASASKEEVQAALRLRFGTRPDELLKEAKIPASSQEHPMDALAAVCCCAESEVVRLLRRAVPSTALASPTPGEV